GAGARPARSRSLASPPIRPSRIRRSSGGRTRPGGRRRATGAPFSSPRGPTAAGSRCRARSPRRTVRAVDVAHSSAARKEHEPMKPRTHAAGRIAAALLTAAAVALAAAAGASAHARISPSVSLSKQLELYSLAVPTEKEGTTTTKVVLTLPEAFSIDSFVPSPWWPP